MPQDGDAVLRYRERAQQLRRIAGGTDATKDRDTLLKIAEEYDRMAQHAIEAISLQFPETKPGKDQ